MRGVKRSDKQIYVSFDEWNVWYKDRMIDGAWSHAPHLLEEIYNLEDALVCAQFLNSFLRHANIVKIACLAQIVNVIAPILTKPDGMLIQSIYYPFLLFSQHARGKSLKPIVDGPSYIAGPRGEVPVHWTFQLVTNRKQTASVSSSSTEASQRILISKCHLVVFM